MKTVNDYVMESAVITFMLMATPLAALAQKYAGNWWQIALCAAVAGVLELVRFSLIFATWVGDMMSLRGADNETVFADNAEDEGNGETD